MRVLAVANEMDLLVEETKCNRRGKHSTGPAVVIVVDRRPVIPCNSRRFSPELTKVP